MRRPVLVTLVVLGSLISLIGSTGLFAALTDSATTGTNTVSTGSLPGSADIQLATATTGPSGEFVCGAYSENLSTGFFSATDIQPGFANGEVRFCIRNVGSQTVDTTVSTLNLSDADTGCTGDEATYDTTCGTGVGELSPFLSLSLITRDCATGAEITGMGTTVYNISVSPVAGPTLTAGAEACLGTNFFYSLSVSDTNRQTIQSDTATWQFKFDATVPSP